MSGFVVTSRKQRDENRLANAEDDVKDFNNSEAAEEAGVKITPTSLAGEVVFNVAKPGKSGGPFSDYQSALDFASTLLPGGLTDD